MESPKSEPGEPRGTVFDVRRIRRLVQLMEEHGVSELELQEGETRIRLTRASAAPPAALVPSAPAHQLAPPIAPAAPPAPATSPAQPDVHRYEEITSPMVGTFYAASAPDAEPYVQVGSHVELDTIVCIIEAMKVYNEVPAEKRGTIVAILVENGEPVEFGRPLFRVDPSR